MPLQGNNSEDSTYVSYANDYENTCNGYVAPAYAPPLAASGDCMGSASARGSHSLLGFSIGKTDIDGNCNARIYAQRLWSIGRQKTAEPEL